MIHKNAYKLSSSCSHPLLFFCFSSYFFKGQKVSGIVPFPSSISGS